MDEKFLKLIQKTEIFNSLSDEECSLIYQYFEITEFDKDKFIFYQGEISDCIYILIEGTLSALLTTEHNEIKMVGTIHQGELVGELGVLSNQPRALSIKTNTLAKLFKLSSDNFIQIFYQYPSIMSKVIHSVINRSQKTIHLLSAKKYCKHISIIPANEKVLFLKFTEQIKSNCHLFSNIVVLTCGDLHSSKSEIVEKINHLEKKYSIILYIVESFNSTLAEIAIEKSSTIYLVGQGASSPSYSQATKTLLKNTNTQQVKIILILFYENALILPVNTQDWTHSYHYTLFHHIRNNNEMDFQRLLRFIIGKPYGLVLGGGGLKGWVHAGVIKALKESNIPIDCIAGTSVGSMVAACYAMTESTEETINKLAPLIKLDRSFRNITWPAISIFSAKKQTALSKKIFGDTKIEDLWINFFCISCNLNLKTEVIHNSGNLWEKVRSSCSVPGIVPPMVIDGQLHFDGGLTNNLPVDVMRQFLGHDSKIIAVTLSLHNKDTNRYNFPPVLPFFSTLLAKLGLRHKEYRFPPFFDTFLNALLLGSSLKEIQSAALADLLISPLLSEYSMLYIKENQTNKLMEIGYNSALEALKERSL